ncbi:hypothetical protein ACWCPI_33705 [Streptomyces sp. NPDC001920]
MCLPKCTPGKGKRLPADATKLTTYVDWLLDRRELMALGRAFGTFSQGY